MQNLENELFADFPEPSTPTAHTSTTGKPIRNYSPALIDVCDKLFFRNSMLDDYRTCGQMMLYKWVMGLEEESQWFASIAGTAGHECIREIHETKQFDLSLTDLMKLFIKHFDETLKSSAVPPRVSVKYPTLRAQVNSVAHEYADMLQGYSEDKQNRKFNVGLSEQSFVLQLKDEFERDFIFVGTLDQAGVYEDGTFALRDIKFRDNSFKPGPTELKLNTQLSLYAYALRNGVPSCWDCAPKYSSEGELYYNGPCENCKRKIGTAAWPGLYVERAEIMWMRDYLRHKRDEFAKEVVSETEMEVNPKTGRSRKKREINEKWLTGYKTGDRWGSGHLVTDRTQAFLQIHIRDMLMQAGMIRDGRFFRKAGPHCNFWCKFQKPCVEAFESQVEEIDVVQVGHNVMTVDPFSD